MPNVKHVWHQFVIRIESTGDWDGYEANIVNRDSVRQKLWEDYQIGTGIHYPIPCHKQSCYNEIKSNCIINAEYNAHKLLSLPMFTELTYDEVKYVVDKLEECLK